MRQSFSIGLFLLVLTLTVLDGSAQEGKITLEPREQWTNLLAGSKVELNFTVKVPRAFKGVLVWKLFDPGTDRNFGTGGVLVESDAGKSTMVKIPLTIPPLDKDVVRKAQLSVSVSEANYEKTVWIFSADPLPFQKNWLRDLKIRLFDPEIEKSKTAEILKSLKDPKDDKKDDLFEGIKLAELTTLKEGVVLVAEGISFTEEKGLAEELVKAASRGVSVLCLAPSAGTVPLPGPEHNLPIPGRFSLRQPDIITELDKRLDSKAWAPDNKVVVSSVIFKVDENNKPVLEIQAGNKGSAWLQLDYAESKGRLVLCGFPIVRQWEASPTPRYLFARLLEHVTEFTVIDPKK